MATTMVKGNGTVAENKGGNKMVEVNEAVRHHCLHCNAVLSKKGRKYCNRQCYNSSRKAGTKTPLKESTQGPVTAPVTVDVTVNAENKAQASVNSGVTSNAIAFEKALVNMKHFKSALTLHRLKKLINIAGETAHVIRVGGGIVIYWFINNEGYMVYYAPGKLVTYKKSNSKEMRTSLKKLAAHKTFKDVMGITEYVKLAEQMKGGE